MFVSIGNALNVVKIFIFDRKIPQIIVSFSIAYNSMSRGVSFAIMKIMVSHMKGWNNCIEAAPYRCFFSKKIVVVTFHEHPKKNSLGSSRPLQTSYNLQFL